MPRVRSHRAACTGVAGVLCLALTTVATAVHAAPSAGHGQASPTAPTSALQLGGEWQRVAEDGETVGRYSDEAGSTYTLRFEGNKLFLFGATAPHHGRATVRVDGGTPVTIDQYAPERREDVLVYESETLPAGEHVAVVEVLGARQEASSDHVVSIDRAVVDSTRRSSPGGGPSDLAQEVTINDGTVGGGPESFQYSGDWESSEDSEGSFAGDEHYSSTAGSTFTLRFTGVRLALHGALAPHHGRATVRIDDGPVTTIDQYAPMREQDAVVYESDELEDREHVAVVEVVGATAPDEGRGVVTVDRAIVTRLTPGTRPTVDDDGDAQLHETAAGPDLRAYASTSSNGEHPLWHVEARSSAVARQDGKLTKQSTAQFHRMFSTRRFGGPGTTLRISYRARATDIRDRPGSSIVQGAKLGLKWPAASSLTGFSKDDPRSVYGNSSQRDAAGPGSYAFLTGLTEGGYMELARNGYGGEGYRFFPNKRVGYTAGTWMDIVVTVEWLEGRKIRVRYYHNATGSGEPVYEATDEDSPFWDEPGFLWLRTDDTDWEYDHIAVRECARECSLG